MIFSVVNAETGELVLKETFKDSALPTRLVSNLNLQAKQRGEKIRYKLKKTIEDNANDEWKHREQSRFDDGTYKKVPWHGESWVITDHFCHVSQEDVLKVAYTPDIESGQNNIKTRMRPGKYLERFYYPGVLSTGGIKYLCDKYSLENREYKVQFATTEEEILRVYLKGPSSCMSHSHSEYESHIHPVRVYAAGDLAVAYLEIEDHITARCLCWPEKKIFGRRYGDDFKLKELLENIGYEDVYDRPSKKSFAGAKLLKIPSENTFVMPFLDSPSCYVIEHDNHFEMRDTDDGIEATNTCGLLNSPRCPYCEETLREPSIVIVDSNGGTDEWCDYCRGNYTWSCYRCEGLYSEELYPIREQSTDDTWCERCAERHLVQCVNCENYWEKQGNKDYLFLIDGTRDKYRCYECYKEWLQDEWTNMWEGTVQPPQAPPPQVPIEETFQSPYITYSITSSSTVPIIQYTWPNVPLSTIR